MSTARGTVILATKLSSALATGIIGNTRAKEERTKAFQIVNRIVYRIRFAVDSDCTAGNGLALEDSVANGGGLKDPCFHNYAPL